MISGSIITRALRCAPSLVLPQAHNSSEAADRGSEEHEELARQVRSGELSPSRQRWIPGAPLTEVKLVYDVATREAKVIGKDTADRNYGKLAPFEIPMSIDVLGIENDSVVVVDWKTGKGDVEPAATNGQLWICALAACRALGKDSACVRLIYTNQDDRCDEYEIDALELADFADQLEAMVLEVPRLQARYRAGEPLTTYEGSWCRYCPAKAACPSKNALLVQVAEKGLALLGDSAMTPARARAGYEQLVKIEGLTRDARKRLEVYVKDNGPIDLGNGRLFGRYSRPGNESLNAEVAVRAMREIGGDMADELTDCAVERKVTKAGIERATKSLGLARGTAGAIIKRTREMGGVSKSPDTMPIGEYQSGVKLSIVPEVDIDEINKELEKA